MARQEITDADEIVVLVRRGSDWSWHDGSLEADGFTSLRAAVIDYEPNADSADDGVEPTVSATIEVRYRRRGPTGASPSSG